MKYFDRFFRRRNQVSCNEVNICHPNAHCVLSTDNSTGPEGEYTCQCNSGYVGDGFQCATEIGSPITPSYSSEVSSDCDVKDTCGPDATCVYDDEALKSVCVCNDGFRGDGLFCTPIGRLISFNTFHSYQLTIFQRQTDVALSLIVT